MPGISGPNFFRMKTLCQLTENGVNAIPHLRQTPRPGVLLLTGLLEGYQQLDPMRFQVRNQIRVPIIPIRQRPTGSAFQHFLDQVQVMHIGRSQTKRGNDPGQDTRRCARSPKKVWWAT